MTVSGWNSPRTENAFTVTSGPSHELLDDRGAAAGLLDRARDRIRKLVLGANERQPLLTLPVGRLDDQDGTVCCKPVLGPRDDVPARLGHAGLREALALLLLGDGEARGRCASIGCGRPMALGDARGDPDRPVDPGRDHALDALGVGEALDALLVLGRDDRPPVRVLEPGRRRVAVERDHEEPPLAGCREQAELRGPGP